LTQLAEKRTGEEGLSEQLLGKDNEFIRPKEVDLLALLEVRAVDYIFIYKSVALQHQLPFLSLPDSINFSKPYLADWYGTSSTLIRGSKPGENVLIKGDAIVYGVTIPAQANNKEAAIAFLQFMLDPEKGGKIMEAAGQPLLDQTVDSRGTPFPPDRIK
jgi:molybdate/tungstate transport system substrate-binding protein